MSTDKNDPKKNITKNPNKKPGEEKVDKKGKNGDYEVGHGKPPKKNQFKPGHSGNKKGRPKKSRNFKTDLEEALSARLTVTEGGKKVKLTAQQAALKVLLQKALKGDPRALDKIIDLAAKNVPEEPDNAQDGPDMPQEDADIIEAYLREHPSKTPSNDEEAKNDDD